ncbi:hypothetical protein N474_03500 [Pseudoalteromonas luteoviolacea CPMOR-2]|uniref:Uncharacterized protein n=1 Tax=Pseudoalteromonas luteoviolacea DSM 6061 TaxID=1365250 RepID=A0A166VFB0_9GAMM|nr:hypothetical protein N475_21550 [Pseudoalteromonas luteoviolacea DSM 6061]KZN50453.1 hypothetical protein N474_03500 [Pseudoalteromonas luteoviolacea CPMOR-2]MBE0385095.1 hypothetical protein [Pseudoalteromonas luteoviolacea DSM 6061]
MKNTQDIDKKYPFFDKYVQYFCTKNNPLKIGNTKMRDKNNAILLRTTKLQ